MHKDAKSGSLERQVSVGESIRPLVISSPVVVLWELTTTCSHRCYGCGNVFDRGHHSVSPGDAELVIERLSGHVLDIRLTGGEPTLHPHFESICRLVDAAVPSFSVLTNGDWADPSHVLDIVSKARHFRGFLISLQGSTADIHDRFVRTQGSFDRVTANIAAATKQGLYVSTNTILHREAVTSLSEIASLAHSLGAAYAVFNRYYGADMNYRIERDQLATAASFLTTERTNGRKMRLGNCVPKCVADCDCDGCPGGNYIATIDPWLNVRPCNHSPVTGGSLQTDRLVDIWMGEKMQAWRHAIPEECRTCHFRDQCAGGCRAEGLLQGQLCDPLVSAQQTEHRGYREDHLKLYGGQKFRSCCSRYPQSFGEMLFFEGEVMLVNRDGAALLDDIERGLSVTGIRQEYGEDGVRVLADLLLCGFVQYHDQEDREP